MTGCFGMIMPIEILKIEKFFTAVSDRLFPTFCLGGCGTEGKWLCSTCWAAFDVEGVFACPVCHRPTLDGAPCLPCKKYSSVTAVAAAVPYRSADCVGRAIAAVKYDFAIEASLVFAAVLELFLRKYPDACFGVDAFIAVPLHPRREASRGYNQADSIVHVLSQTTGIPAMHAVVRRCRYTKQQTRLEKTGREENLRHAFVVSSGVFLAGKRICLVDDVYTTGATMQACAEALRAAGAADVRGFVLARG